MTVTSKIRRHPNGSIDTGHYAQIGHQRRSEALYAGARAIKSVLRRPIIRMRVRPELRELNDACPMGVARAMR